MIKSTCVFCGSVTGVVPDYSRTAEQQFINLVEKPFFVCADIQELLGRMIDFKQQYAGCVHLSG